MFSDLAARLEKSARIVPCATSISVTPAAWVDPVTLLTPHEWGKKMYF